MFRHLSVAASHNKIRVIFAVTDRYKTRVERCTVFSACGRFKPFKQIGSWLALLQAHRHVAHDWQRIASASNVQAAAMEPAGYA